MTESTSRPVDLSTLSDKQLAKEYKSIGKGIKSKDPEIKADAFQKIKDVRYFTHGGCLVPLVESLVPKKVIYFQSDSEVTWLYLIAGHI